MKRCCSPNRTPRWRGAVADQAPHGASDRNEYDRLVRQARPRRRRDVRRLGLSSAPRAGCIAPHRQRPLDQRLTVVFRHLPGC